MTDRHYAYTVSLAQDIREDDAEQIVNAIGMIKHVIGITPLVVDPSHYTAELRAKREIMGKILAIMHEEYK